MYQIISALAQYEIVQLIIKDKQALTKNVWEIAKW